MSQTRASALDDRIVTFVDINDDYNCVICMNVADNPVRHSVSCRGIFCDDCMEQALNYNDCCPFCREEQIDISTDVVIRNLILTHEVYCINNSPDINMILDEKCNWIGTYDQLVAHLKLCEFEIVECANNGCADKIERREVQPHQVVCLHRTENCNHCADIFKSLAMPGHLQECPKVLISCECGYECTRDALVAHRDKDCPLVEIGCDVLGCDVRMRRGDYGKHQDESSSYHIRLLSTALRGGIEIISGVQQESVRLASTLSNIKDGNEGIVVDINNINMDDMKWRTEVHNLQTNNVKSTASVLQISKEITKTNPMQVKWKITDIAAKLLAAAGDAKRYSSPRFDVFFHGSHKLYILAEIQGKRLALYLHKDGPMSDDKNRLDIGGTSFTVTKAGLPDMKCTLGTERFLEPPEWQGYGYPNFLEDMTSYIDNDGINIIINLKLNKENEPLFL